MVRASENDPRDLSLTKNRPFCLLLVWVQPKKTSRTYVLQVCCSVLCFLCCFVIYECVSRYSVIMFAIVHFSISVPLYLTLFGLLCGRPVTRLSATHGMQPSLRHVATCVCSRDCRTTAKCAPSPPLPYLFFSFLRYIHFFLLSFLSSGPEKINCLCACLSFVTLLSSYSHSLLLRI